MVWALALVIVLLFGGSIFDSALATTLDTPVVQVDSLTHYYDYFEGETGYDEWGAPVWLPAWTSFGDAWSPQTDGPSFIPDLSQMDYYNGNYYDSATVSVTAGPGKMFVVDPASPYDTWVSVRVLFSMYSQSEPSAITPLELLPESTSIRLLGSSGEVVAEKAFGRGHFTIAPGLESEYGWYFGESLLVHTWIPVTQHLEFSRIEVTCNYSVWPEQLLLADEDWFLYGEDYWEPYTLRANGTSIGFVGYCDGLVVPDGGTFSAIVPIPEPGGLLLLGLSGLLIGRRAASTMRSPRRETASPRLGV